MRSGVLHGATALIDELGGHVDQVRESAGIADIAFSDEEYPLSARQVITFLSLAAASCRREDFGLLLSARQTLSILGPIWLLMESATDVRQMLTDLARYFVLHTRGAMVHVESVTGGLTVSYSMAATETADDRQTIELGLGLLCSELRHQAGPGWHPRVVQLRHRPPRDRTTHRAVLGPNIDFDQDCNTVTLDAALLNQPLVTARTAHHALLDAWLDGRRRGSKAHILHTVETTVSALLPYSTCTIGQVAQALALSERSLQRQLHGVASSFSGIRDRIRAELAMKYLRQSNLRSAEIADILGYSDLSALSRSFRRWHGITARQVRQGSTPTAQDTQS